MKQLLQFIQNHWVLCSALGITLILLIFEELRNKINGIPKISTHNATLLLNRDNALVVDLRNQKAFVSGHIIHSINIEPGALDSHMKKLEAHKNHPIILVNENDTNALPVGIKLQKLGFTKIHLLAGGITSWKNAQLPLLKD